MEVVNDFKLVNVRVSKPTFEHIKQNAPFVEDKIPSSYGQTESILKGQVAVCNDFHIEMMIKNLDKRINDTYNVKIIKDSLALKCELGELWGAMKKGGFLFSYIMAK